MAIENVLYFQKIYHNYVKLKYDLNHLIIIFLS